VHIPLLATGPALVAHTIAEWLAIAVGVQIYRRSSALLPRTVDGYQRLIILAGAAMGAAVGSKAAFFLYDPQALRTLLSHPALIVGGQSIVGGLLGGLLGVEIAKWCTGVRSSTGDAFVVPILVGIIIGRVGCFLAGLNDVTYGNPTSLPWGVDFGDGIPRHPTQIYDQLFAVGLLALLLRARVRLREVPGLQFKAMLAGYLVWRLAIDSLKPMPFVYPGGLSGIQVLCLGALILYMPFVRRAALQRSTFP
jgi:phosphatidylglycerol---prolipoprotein diacylglyceryl transferase